MHDFMDLVKTIFSLSQETAKIFSYFGRIIDIIIKPLGRKHATDFLKLQGILTNNASILANRLFDRTKGRPGM